MMMLQNIVSVQKELKEELTGFLRPRPQVSEMFSGWRMIVVYGTYVFLKGMVHPQ